MTSRFRSDLVLMDTEGHFTLAAPLVYESESLKRVLIVPAGEPTDLASIPRPLWAILPPIGKYDRAAVVHDFLYRHNGVTRAQADAVLNEAMEVLGVRRTQRWAIYAGVRMGGFVAWNRYRAAEQVAAATP